VDKQIIIGKIVGVQGIKGEVRVFPFTDDMDRFERLGQITLVKGLETQQMRIESSRIQKNVVILTLEEIADRNQAEALKGWEIAIEPEDLEQLPEGRYYIFQLVGLTVFTMEHQELGILTDVLQTGANDVYVVKTAEGKELLLPALKSVVKKIDLQTKEMLVDPLPGLLD
jgi:16S rRNA processing protein RimM